MSQILRIRQTQRYARRRTFAARCGERAGQWSRRIRNESYGTGLLAATDGTMGP